MSLLDNLDMHVEYGCWISPDAEIESGLPVIVADRPYNVTSVSSANLRIRRENIYADLFRFGYVEIRYKGSATLELWGSSEAIARVREVWQPLTAPVARVVVNFVHVDACPKIGEMLKVEQSLSFMLPKESVELYEFFGQRN